MRDVTEHLTPRAPQDGAVAALVDADLKHNDEASVTVKTGEQWEPVGMKLMHSAASGVLTYSLLTKRLPVAGGHLYFVSSTYYETTPMVHTVGLCFVPDNSPHAAIAPTPAGGAYAPITEEEIKNLIDKDLAFGAKWARRAALMDAASARLGRPVRNLLPMD